MHGLKDFRDCLNAIRLRPTTQLARMSRYLVARYRAGLLSLKIPLKCVTNRTRVELH